ncbi:MAG: heavy metal-binding domain-containing protein [Geobacter sp.]|nr:heavy metal-binding domain-containing protein [Geobacter sp.]
MSHASSHNHVTNLSGNEIYCLNKLSLSPGNICIGNSVFALGILGSLTAGLNILFGGEIPDVTSLIHDGRLNAINRMLEEAKASGGTGVTGVTNRCYYRADQPRQQY